LDDKRYKNITDLYSKSVIFRAVYEAQNTDKNEKRWEYDLTTNSVKFMQHTTSPLSESDSSVCKL